MKPHRGFTLIELMIAVAVIAILAAIAFPYYQDHLRKGRRAAAQGFMMEVANREQQYLLDARNYAVNIPDLSVANSLNITTPAEVSPYYTVKVDPGAPTTPPTYTVTATPKPNQAADAYGVMTLNHEGAKFRNNGAQPGW